jgi:hypothetical protein
MFIFDKLSKKYIVSDIFTKKVLYFLQRWVGVSAGGDVDIGM